MRLKVSDSHDETVEMVWRLRDIAARATAITKALMTAPTRAAAVATRYDPFVARMPFARSARAQKALAAEGARIIDLAHVRQHGGRP